MGEKASLVYLDKYFFSFYYSYFALYILEKRWITKNEIKSYLYRNKYSYNVW
jgi:hypothetical protein